jgi:hypothetical protein
MTEASQERRDLFGVSIDDQGKYYAPVGSPVGKMVAQLTSKHYKTIVCHPET